MKIHVTLVTSFSGKDGREWVKVDFIDARGEVGTTMFAKGAFATPEIDITPEQLSEFSETEIEFNPRGRMVSVG